MQTAGRVFNDRPIHSWFCFRYGFMLRSLKAGRGLDFGGEVRPKFGVALWMAACVFHYWWRRGGGQCCKLRVFCDFALVGGSAGGVRNVMCWWVFGSEGQALFRVRRVNTSSSVGMISKRGCHASCVDERKRHPPWGSNPRPQG